VVEQQAGAVITMFARAAREGWLGSSLSDSGHSPGVIELRWEGPFELIVGGALPTAAAQSVAQLPGIYLWTIQIEDDFHICYVGKTDRSFAIRLAEEIEYERYRSTKHFDPEAFAMGRRIQVPRPADPQVAREDIETLLGMTRIFMAPIVVSPEVLRAVERELIHALQGVSPACRSFLANCPANPSALPLALTSLCTVRLVGLEGVSRSPT
jgi:hypothetical protein